MLRNYFMAVYDVEVTPETTTIYQYPIKWPNTSGQWIPIFLVEIPYPLSNNIFHLPNDGGNMILGTRVTNDDLPEWVDGVSLKRFLEHYQDDLMEVNVSGSGDSNILMAGHATYNEVSIFNGSKIFGFRSFKTYGGHAVILIGHTSDDHYRTPVLHNSNFMFESSFAEMTSDIENGKYKGMSPASQYVIGYSVIRYDNYNENEEAWCRALLKKSKKYNPNNPYPNAPGDDPDDPGDGDFDYTPDDIPVPDLPTTSVTDSGLVTLYAPTNAQLKALASFLWSDAFSLDTFKKMFNNPMDCILGLTILPINVPHGSAREITVGNIVSTVSCDTLPTQYTSLDCGTFKFSQSSFTGSYLDFSPYTKCYLYLPFIGCQEIDIDEFMGSTMGIVYHIDILTGAMFCYVTRNGAVIYTYAGQCAENVPLSSNDFSTTLGSILQIGLAGAGAVATIASAGAAAPATAAAATALEAKTTAGVVGAGITGANAVMNSKPSVSHSGSLGGGGGMMGVMYPYLIFIAPRASIPSSQNSYTGFPANKIVKLSSLSGFSVVEAVNLSVKGCNDSEMSEIDQYLKAGVII